MEDAEYIERFYNKIAEQSKYVKVLDVRIIKQMAELFEGKRRKIEYGHDEVDDALKMALDFYKDYNLDYYQIIAKSIENGEIDLNSDVNKVNTSSNKCYIKSIGNDSDLYIIVHELAHFIDRKTGIIDDEYHFFSEVVSLYMEKMLEKYLEERNLCPNLISARRSNRIRFERDMLRAMSYELYYEELYKENPDKVKENIDMEKLKYIMGYDSNNLVNYYIRYPIGNILSEYMLEHPEIKFEPKLSDELYKIYISKLVDDYSEKKRTKKKILYADI